MPETSPTSQRTSAHFFPANTTADDASSAQASRPTRLGEDVRLWNKLKVEGRNNLRDPNWYCERDVLVNHSRIRCANNDCNIKIASGDDKPPLPIHAHSVVQLPTAESSCSKANPTYAAGQSPTEHNYKNMLIQGIESGLGTFQLVSTRAHRHERDSKETPLITLLNAGWTDRSQPFDLSDRYQVTGLKKITGDYNKSDDHVRYEMTIRETQNPDKIITIPLTQAALPFTDRVLQPDKIKRAHHLMQAHCDACEDYARTDKRALAWKNLMVLSHAGYGRNATVITYCRIAALAEQGATVVTEHNLCENLEEAIRTGMQSRDPNFVHSQPQMSALRKALENWFGEKKVAARAVPRDDGAQRFRMNAQLRGAGWVMSAAAPSTGASTTAAPTTAAPTTAAPTTAAPTTAAPTTAAPTTAAPTTAAPTTAAPTTAVPTTAAPTTAAPTTAAPTTAAPTTAAPTTAAPTTAAPTTAAPTTAAPTTAAPATAAPTTAAPAATAPSTAAATAAPIVAEEPVFRAAQNKQRLQSSSERRNEVVEFFGGRLSFEDKNSNWVTIKTVLKNDNFDLEEEHQFIQRLFPIDTRSDQQKSVNEPVLDVEDFVALRGNAIVSNGLDEAFNKMLGFFGLKWEGKNIVVHDLEQARECFTPLPLNHNNLRASRMIRSMALFGKTAKAKALHTFLKDFCEVNFKNHPSLVHWEEVFNKPLAMNKAGTEQPDYPGLLFPNKSLMGDKEEPPLGKIKKALFDKQQQFYEAACLKVQHVAAPLIARFTKSTISLSYAANKHLEEQFNPPNICNISSHPGLYFCSDTQVGAQSLQHRPYKVHVDFANEKFGGG